MQLSLFKNQLINRLRAVTATPELEAAILLTHILKCERHMLWQKREQVLSAYEIEQTESLITRRLAHEPIAYILGEKEFYGRTFHVSPATLIPRPDSETLIEAVIKEGRGTRDEGREICILDLGTGSGCLLLTLLAEIPESRGVGVDISADALAIAQKNATRHNLENRVSFIRSNWCDALTGTFDIIISNPPYIASEEIPTLAPDVKNFEPVTALDGGHNGLSCYQTLCKTLPNFCTPHTRIFFEIGIDQEKEIIALAEKNSFQCISTHQDLGGITRVLEFQKR